MSASVCFAVVSPKTQGSTRSSPKPFSHDVAPRTRSSRAPRGVVASSPPPAFETCSAGTAMSAVAQRAPANSATGRQPTTSIGAWRVGASIHRWVAAAASPEASTAATRSGKVGVPGSCVSGPNNTSKGQCHRYQEYEISPKYCSTRLSKPGMQRPDALPPAMTKAAPRVGRSAA